jgi:hypothetical protein
VFAGSPSHEATVDKRRIIDVDYLGEILDCAQDDGRGTPLENLEGGSNG